MPQLLSNATVADNYPVLGQGASLNAPGADEIQVLVANASVFYRILAGQQGVQRGSSEVGPISPSTFTIPGASAIAFRNAVAGVAARVVAAAYFPSDPRPVGATQFTGVLNSAGGVATTGVLSYVEQNTPVAISATTEGTANEIVKAASLTLDGVTPILITFYAPTLIPGTSGQDWRFILYDAQSNTVLGTLAELQTTTSAAPNTHPGPPVLLQRRYTPAAGTYVFSIRAWVVSSTGTVQSGGGGAGTTVLPIFVKVTTDF